MNPGESGEGKGVKQLQKKWERIAHPIPGDRKLIAAVCQQGRDGLHLPSRAQFHLGSRHGS